MRDCFGYHLPSAQCWSLWSLGTQRSWLQLQHRQKRSNKLVTSILHPTLQYQINSWIGQRHGFWSAPSRCLQRCSTAGLKADPCHTAPSTILLRARRTCEHQNISKPSPLEHVFGLFSIHQLSFPLRQKTQDWPPDFCLQCWKWHRELWGVWERFPCTVHCRGFGPDPRMVLHSYGALASEASVASAKGNRDYCKTE